MVVKADAHRLAVEAHVEIGHRPADQIIRGPKHLIAGSVEGQAREDRPGPKARRAEIVIEIFRFQTEVGADRIREQP